MKGGPFPWALEGKEVAVAASLVVSRDGYGREVMGLSQEGLHRGGDVGAERREARGCGGSWGQLVVCGLGRRCL